MDEFNDVVIPYVISILDSLGLDLTESNQEFIIDFYYRNSAFPSDAEVLDELGDVTEEMDEEEEEDSGNSTDDYSDVKKVIKNLDDVEINQFSCVRNPLNSECLLCYDAFVSSDIVRILQCNHLYHRCCIDNYLKYESVDCPMCKSPAGDYTYSNM